ncbi:MAG: hypothetical protein WC489_03895 [Patescibacteria group bacterium]
MKIIYSGGWNNKLQTSIEDSFMYTYRSTIKQAVENGKKIAMVTLAKPDGYYDPLITHLYKEFVDVIDSKKQNVEWNSYDGIFILGGKSDDLKSGLLKTKFNLNILKKNVVLLGDSAGAHVLSSYFYISPVGEQRGVELEFTEGFCPKAKLIGIVHKNNPVYCNKILVSKVNQFAKKKGLRVLILNENEQKMLENGVFINVDKNKLFSS